MLKPDMMEIFLTFLKISLVLEDMGPVLPQNNVFDVFLFVFQEKQTNFSLVEMK